MWIRALPMLFTCLALAIGAANAAPKKPVEIAAKVTLSPKTAVCSDFTNLGTRNPKILNSCNYPVTVVVKNYDRRGRLVATRTLHLWDKSTRPIAFPGYTMGIESEKGWSSDGEEDGTRFLRLSHHDVDGDQEVWDAYNSNPGRYLAFECAIYENGRYYGTSYLVLEPGQSAHIFVTILPERSTLGIS